MPVKRIEKIERGVVVQTADPAKSGPDKGKYFCLPFGANVDPIPFATLDEAATYLRAHPKAGIRMNPDWSKVSRNICIDGVPR